MSSPAMEPEGPLTSSIERLRHELDRWLDVARERGERALETVGLTGMARWALPAVDVIEQADEIHVFADVPGVSADQVELTLVGNMLTLKGERLTTVTTPGAQFHMQERHCGRFSRSIPLPCAVNPDVVTAETRDGVLHVRLAKADRARARQIPITTRTNPPCEPGTTGGI